METPEEIIGQFYSVLPSKLSPTILEEYGLHLNHPNTQRTTQEILSLSLFWMEQAFRVTLPKELGNPLLEEIYQLVRRAWQKDYELNPEEENPFFEKMAQQHSFWEKIVKHGGEPVAVLSEAVSCLEAKNIIDPEDHQKLLALFLDLVPIEDIGETAGRIEEELAG